MAEREGLDANIQPLKIHVESFSDGLRSQICINAALSGRSSGEARLQARTLMNSELPNFTVLSTGISKVCVRADSLSIVRMTTIDVFSILRGAATATLLMHKRVPAKMESGLSIRDGFPARAPAQARGRVPVPA